MLEGPCSKASKATKTLTGDHMGIGALSRSGPGLSRAPEYSGFRHDPVAPGGLRLRAEGLLI